MPTLILDCRIRFREVAWDEVKAGDWIYYYIKRRRGKPANAHGPFAVVDPTICQLRNTNGVALKLPNVQLLVPDDVAFSGRH